MYFIQLFFTKLAFYQGVLLFYRGHVLYYYTVGRSDLLQSYLSSYLALGKKSEHQYYFKGRTIPLSFRGINTGHRFSAAT